MANQKLTDLTQASTPLVGTEQVYVVQGGNSRKATAQQLADVPGEWSGETVSQAEAEAGTATTRRAWTAQRVAQAIAAWWAASTAKTKLDGIASGATANATDAQLRDRSTHTGTQAAGTITGLATVATSGAYSDLSDRPTLGTAAPLDVAAAGDASASQVVKGNDSRLTDARTPTAHTQTATTISDSTTAGRALLTAADAAAQRTALGLGSAALATTGTSAGNVPVLDGSGLVPSALLPSYVDDVLEFTNLAAFPATGETGKIYVARDTNKTYRWGGSSYIEISPSPGSTDAVPEGSVNLYFTTGRASAAAPVQSVAGKTGAVTLVVGDVSGAAASGAIGSSGLTLATARLLGRSTAGTGALEELTLPTGFDLSGGALRAPAEIGIACSDETSSLTTGTAKVTFRMPYAMTLTAVRLNVNTAPTGSALVVDIKEGGVSIFSTKPQIDAGAKTSVGSGTPAVISDTALADNAEITIDIDQIGSTVAGTGLKVWLIGRRA